MAEPEGYEQTEVPWEERSPATIMLTDGVRSRKTDDGYVLEVLLSDNVTWVSAGGIGFPPATYSESGDISDTAGEVLIDASNGPVTLVLRATTGQGKPVHCKKIDESANIVTIQARGDDLIDGSDSVTLAEQWADCFLIDASVGYWDNTGPE